MFNFETSYTIPKFKMRSIKIFQMKKSAWEEIAKLLNRLDPKTRYKAGIYFKRKQGTELITITLIMTGETFRQDPCLVDLSDPPKSSKLARYTLIGAHSSWKYTYINNPKRTSWLHRFKQYELEELPDETVIRVSIKRLVHDKYFPEHCRNKAAYRLRSWKELTKNSSQYDHNLI